MSQSNLKIIQGLSETITSLTEYQGAKKIPDVQGLYAFWWINSNTAELEKLYRTAKLKGKQMGEEYQYHDIHWKWNLDQSHVCLYVGKATSIRKRVKLHLLESVPSDEWYKKEFKRYGSKGGKPHTPDHAIDLILKRSTSCQFRAGIEHLYKHSTPAVDLNLKNIGFSFLEVSEAIERFYLEDLAIGWHRPWFNVDSER